MCTADITKAFSPVKTTDRVESSSTHKGQTKKTKQRLQTNIEQYK